MSTLDRRVRLKSRPWSFLAMVPTQDTMTGGDPSRLSVNGRGLLGVKSCRAAGLGPGPGPGWVMRGNRMGLVKV